MASRERGLGKVCSDVSSKVRSPFASAIRRAGIDRRAAIVSLALISGALVASSVRGTLRAEDLSALLRPEVPARDARLRESTTLDSYHPFTPSSSREEWETRAERVRRQILVAAGLWPLPEKTDLRAVIHGRVDRDAYTVERVFFQSYPGFYVTGNLYRPKVDKEREGRERRPAVLSPHGHWSDGRMYRNGDDGVRRELDAGAELDEASARYPLQARCAMLARMGCIVFHYDMVGYADSTQIPHAAGFGDLEAELRSQSAFGLQTWNTLRAFDFLVSLDDVDPERIAVTGASGGGTQTFILCAVDPRPAVGFPAVMVSTAMQGGCVCENASHLRVETGNIEFAALAAPRPYGLTAAEDWTRELLEKGYPELRAHWALLGQPELVRAWRHLEFGHNYNRVSREHMYSWLNRHLTLGFTTEAAASAETVEAADSPSLEAVVRERPFEPIDPRELSVFDASHPRPLDAVDAAGLRRYLTRTQEAALEDLLPEDAEEVGEFRRVIGGALETLVHDRLPPAEVVRAREAGEARVELDGGAEGGGDKDEDEELVVRRLLLSRGAEDEEGATRDARPEAVPILWVEPSDWTGVVLIVASSRGKADALFEDGALRTIPRRLADAGAALLGVDVLLTGETAAGDREESTRSLPDAFPRDSGRHARFAGYTYGYNRTLLAERVHDLLTTIAWARSRPGVRRVRLLGVDDGANWALLAGALAGEALDETVLTERSIVDWASLESIDDERFLPGALRFGGAPVFAALFAPQRLSLLGDSERWDRTARIAAIAGGAFERLASDAPEAVEALFARIVLP